jgi:hypothetical protein
MNVVTLTVNAVAAAAADTDNRSSTVETIAAGVEAVEATIGAAAEAFVIRATLPTDVEAEGAVGVVAIVRLPMPIASLPKPRCHRMPPPSPVAISPTCSYGSGIGTKRRTPP